MITLSNGNIFCVTGHLCGEFTGHRWIPHHKGQWRGTLMFSLICAWVNYCVNIREAGDLRCHRAHYNVTTVRISLNWAKLQDTNSMNGGGVDTKFLTMNRRTWSVRKKTNMLNEYFKIMSQSMLLVKTNGSWCNQNIETLTALAWQCRHHFNNTNRRWGDDEYNLKWKNVSPSAICVKLDCRCFDQTGDVLTA